MAASIRTQNPSFHSLRADAPVGRVPQIFTSADYAGTITQVWRHNTHYWSITTREALNAFSNPTLGFTAHVWYDQASGQYVADYHSQRFGSVEITRTRDPLAALGAAITDTAERGHLAYRW